MINGPEAFTPDGEFILGESTTPRVLRRRGVLRPRDRRRRGGRQGHGRVDRGRRARARRVADGHPTLRQSVPEPAYALVRAEEIYATYYDIHYPDEEREAGGR